MKKSWWAFPFELLDSVPGVSVQFSFEVVLFDKLIDDLSKAFTLMAFQVQTDLIYQR